MKRRTNVHSHDTGKLQSYQKDRRDIRTLVPKLRKVKKNRSPHSKD